MNDDVLYILLWSALVISSFLSLKVVYFNLKEDVKDIEVAESMSLSSDGADLKYHMDNYTRRLKGRVLFLKVSFVLCCVILLLSMIALVQESLSALGIA